MLWGTSRNAANTPKFSTMVIQSNAAYTAPYTNTTVSAFVSKQVVGTFGANTQDMANTQVSNKGAAAGWQLVRRGTGDIASITVTAAGSGFANGETITIANGTVNAIGTITTNATGNMVSVFVTQSGAGWVNSTVANTSFNREKHMVNITVGGTPTGYSNTDTIVASNGTINATATVVTNATGGFVTANVTITNPGLWANTKANTDVSFTVIAANGSVSAGSGATFTANIGSSTGGTVTVTVGGRAGRIMTETLVAAKSIA